MNKAEKIKAEIERRKNEYMAQANTFESLGMTEEMNFFAKLASNMAALIRYIDSLEEEPVSNDLEEAARKIATWHSHITGDTYIPNDAWFFKKGAQWQKEQLLNNAIEREVKVDAGGYPYIDVTELYDYDKDKPLAKKGDKVKLIIIMEK